MKKTPSLYVASATRQSTGKTALCLGLALKWREEGVKTGYFKPLGWHTTSRDGNPLDEDTLHMREILNMEEPNETITPILLEHQYLDQYSSENNFYLLDKVKEAYRQIAKDKDLVIIEALHEPSLGAFLKLSAPDISEILGSHMIMVSTAFQDMDVDGILFRHSCISKRGTKCAGVIFNRIQEMMDDRMKKVIVPSLEKHGIRVWGLIPESTTLTAPTVRELVSSLGGEVLCGERNLTNLVERYLVGAMTQESALRYFRRVSRKAVITGGDRPDISLAALETDTSALVLTGNLHPDPRVLAKAEEKGVPILLVPFDTYTAVEKLRDITGKIKAHDKDRIDEAEKLVSEHVDWKGLLSRVK